jgi:hypothetical protein
MKVLLGFLSFVFVCIWSSLLNGWAFTKLWSWFIVPVFSAPQLSIPAAIGLYLVVSFLTHQYIKDDDKDKDFFLKIGEAFVISTYRPLVALSFGYIVKMWM